jgi:hypothetical protein
VLFGQGYRILQEAVRDKYGKMMELLAEETEQNLLSVNLFTADLT